MVGQTVVKPTKGAVVSGAKASAGEGESSAAIVVRGWLFKANRC